MASIAKRPDGQWRARYRDARNKEHARHFARKIDAQRWLDSVTTAVQTGTYVDPSRARLTVGEMAARWLESKANLKPSTRARYVDVLAVHVLPRWGDVQLVRVEHGDVQAWIAQLAAGGLSGASVRKVVGVLSGVLGLAVRDRRLPSNPASGAWLPPLAPARRRYLDATQVHALASASGEAGRLVVLLLSYCGLRWGEMAALRISSLDLMRRRIRVAESVTEINGGRLVWGTPKTHQSRSVPVPRFLIDELAAHVAGRSQDDLVFGSATGNPLRNRSARRSWFDRAAVEIGMPGLVPHELRHTAASLAVSSGANVLVVSRMLGHANPALTLSTYADLFDADLDAVADRLDEAAREALARTAADSARTGLAVLPIHPPFDMAVAL